MRSSRGTAKGKGDSARSSLRLLSPALSTLFLIVLHVVLGWSQHSQQKRSDGLAGAAAEGPIEPIVQTRVTVAIKRIEDISRERRSLPKSEAELFRLLERESAIVFDTSEVDVVGTPSREFAEEEGGVIVLRRAKLGRMVTQGHDRSRAAR